MQTPDTRTPVDTCLRLGAFHAGMLREFPEHARLARRIETASRQLNETQTAYEAVIKELIPPRVEVRVTDYLSDHRVRMIFLAAKTADEGRPGPASEQLFPDGMSVIVEPVGPTEVTELRNLETRLEKFGGPIAREHLRPLRELRQRYEAALVARNTALQAVGAKRELRNHARRVWLDAYAANQGAIREAYPRDRRMQNLFFDDVRVPAAEGGVDEGGADATSPERASVPGAAKV